MQFWGPRWFIQWLETKREIWFWSLLKQSWICVCVCMNGGCVFVFYVCACMRKVQIFIPRYLESVGVCLHTHTHTHTLRWSWRQRGLEWFTEWEVYIRNSCGVYNGLMWRDRGEEDRWKWDRVSSILLLTWDTIYKKYTDNWQKCYNNFWLPKIYKIILRS